MRGSDGDTRPKRPIAHNLSPHLSEWWLYWSNDHKIDTKAFDRSFDQSAATKTSSIYDCIGRSEVSPTIGINPSSSLICLCCDASTKTNHHCVFLTMGLIYVYALQGPIFLDAFSHLYKRVCPSVRPSVHRSLGPPVHLTRDRKREFFAEGNEGKCFVIFWCPNLNRIS